MATTIDTISKILDFGTWYMVQIMGTSQTIATLAFKDDTFTLPSSMQSGSCIAVIPLIYGANSNQVAIGTTYVNTTGIPRIESGVVTNVRISVQNTFTANNAIRIGCLLILKRIMKR